MPSVGLGLKAFQSFEFSAFLRLLLVINVRNKRGPNMDPWGTPLLTASTFEVQPSNFTYCDRLKFNMFALCVLWLVGILRHFIHTLVANSYWVLPSSHRNCALFSWTFTAYTLAAGAAMMFRVYDAKLVITACACHYISIRYPVWWTCDVFDHFSGQVHY